VGIEALSRGADHVMFVERAPVALKVLRANLARLGLTAGFSIHSGSVGAYLRRARTESKQFDLIFLDPPYDASHEYATTLGLLGGAAANLLSTGAVVIAEHRRKETLEDRYGSLARARLLEQGDAALSFYSDLESTATG
jgi:16S rRNA G966 N2-methylase RsmD